MLSLKFLHGTFIVTKVPLTKIVVVLLVTTVGETDDSGRGHVLSTDHSFIHLFKNSTEQPAAQNKSRTVVES